MTALRSFLDSMAALTDPLPPHQRLVQPILTPRFVPTCSDGLLRELGRLAKEERRWVTSHMCESRDQMDWVESTRGKRDEVVFDEVSLHLALYRNNSRHKGTMLSAGWTTWTSDDTGTCHELSARATPAGQGERCDCCSLSSVSVRSSMLEVKLIPGLTRTSLTPSFLSESKSCLSQLDHVDFAEHLTKMYLSASALISRVAMLSVSSHPCGMR